MSTLSLRLPNSLHERLGKIARRGDNVSINQLISSAVAEKVSALMTEEYLSERATRGSRRKFAAVLKRVPAADPDAADRLPNQRLQRSDRRTSHHGRKTRAAGR